MKTITAHGFALSKYFTLIFLLNCTWAFSQEKPNIILIMADDLGREVLECYGNENNFTPNLNQLAAKGMRFENCHSTPLCTPSRVQIMTGKYNDKNYVGFGILDPAEKTFGHYLKEEGYATCIAGKWQLFGNERQQKLVNGRQGSLPKEAGFDHYLLWQVKDRGYRFKHPTLEESNGDLVEYPNQYGPDLFVDYINEFITQHKEEPFFVYYPMVLVHDPFEPTPHDKTYDYTTQKVNDPKFFEPMVRYMDEVVGKIIRKVEELNLSEQTLILFIGDNGTDRDVVSRYQGKKLRGNKGYTNDLGTHVPFLAYWPNTIPSGTVNDNLIDFTDILPSMLDLSHSKVDRDDLDGLSFIPQLKNPKNGPKRDWIYCAYDPNWGRFEPARFIYNTEWKLYDDGRIYDLTEDLYEKYPLTYDQLQPEDQKLILTFKEQLAQRP